MVSAAVSFGHTVMVTGAPEDLAGLAGTATDDLFVFGDIRDAVREGAPIWRMASRPMSSSLGSLRGYLGTAGREGHNP